MELSEFVAATLQQIVEGVSIAQKASGGENINASVAGNPLSGHLVNAGDMGVFTRVDFDVAISAEQTGGGHASLKVYGIGAEGGGGQKHTAANRVAFSVPIRLPDGDPSRKNERDRSFRDAARKAEEKRGGWQAA